MYPCSNRLNPYTRPIYSTYILDLYTRPIYSTYILWTCRHPPGPGLGFTHVGKVGRGHKQVVLHTTGQSRPFLDIYSLILKSYLTHFDYSVFDSQLPGLSYFAGSTSPGLLPGLLRRRSTTITGLL